MTQVTKPRPFTRDALPRPFAPSGGTTRPGAGRWATVATMIVALLASGLTQQWAVAWKDANAGAQAQVAERGALSGMDSYALALMLGGLRGPLVMVLWSKVENQKIDRDLEDVDTMIEWIRLLQPEFDTVHIFQIWNKAYNISVMMASTASKYLTILDAVDYARRVDRDRPGDINILSELGQIYTDKLGGKNVSERAFYRRQFREDSLTDAGRRRAFPEDDGRYHRLGVKYFGSVNGPLLDENNNIEPALLTPRHSHPADLPRDSEWNDGSELQYLAPYQPFPYGISPSAMGYNYAKRAQVAMTVNGQRPLQLSDTVIDSRPALNLKQWAEEEADRAVGLEADAFGLAVQPDATALSLEVPTASAAALSRVPANPRAVVQAVYSYGLCVKVCQDALREYDRHLANPQFVNHYQSYASHKEDVHALQLLSTADGAYLSAFVPGQDRAQSLARAAEGYRAARAAYQEIILRHYIEDPVAKAMYPEGDPSRVPWSTLSSEQLDQMFAAAMTAIEKLPPQMREHDDQRTDIAPYIARCADRLAQIDAARRSLLQTQ